MTFDSSRVCLKKIHLFVIRCQSKFSQTYADKRKGKIQTQTLRQLLLFLFLIMNFLCLYFTASFVTTRVLGFSNIQRKNRPPVELYTSKNVLKPEGEKVNKDTGEFGFRELDNQNQIDTDVDQDEIILQTNEGGENKWERRKATNFVDELEKVRLLIFINHSCKDFSSMIWIY